VVAGIILVVMFVGLSLVIGSAQEHTVRRIQARSADVKRWGGWILVAIGTWFLVLAIWADFFAEIFPV
jgi:cytochrome c biogenesis protein CcdA